MRLHLEDGEYHWKGGSDRNCSPQWHLWKGFLVDEPHLLGGDVDSGKSELNLPRRKLIEVSKSDILRQFKLRKHLLNLELELVAGQESGDDHALPHVLFDLCADVGPAHQLFFRL